MTFQREDGVAENFHTAQNRPLLEQLASQTGGRYWKPSDLKNLPRDISYSEAGISVRTTKELWNMPIVFLLLLGLPIDGMAAAPQVGCGMKRALCCWSLVCARARAAGARRDLLRDRRRPRRRAGLRAALHRGGKRSRQIFKAAGRVGARHHAHRRASHGGAIARRR